MDRMLNYRPKYLNDIRTVACGHKYIYDRGDGRRTAFLHYADGMEIWESCPGPQGGWELALRIIDKKGVRR